jgi:hypothetical protein
VSQQPLRRAPPMLRTIIVAGLIIEVLLFVSVFSMAYIIF